MIFKDPVWVPSPLPEHVNSEDFDNEQDLNMKLNSKLEVHIEREEQTRKITISQPCLNLCEFLIQRDKPLNLYEIRTIIYDLLLTLQ